jgi:hypothetical protein
LEPGSSQTVLTKSIPRILLADTIKFADKLNFKADRLNIFMLKKALKYLAAGKQSRTEPETVAA